MNLIKNKIVEQLKFEVGIFTDREITPPIFEEIVCDVILKIKDIIEERLNEEAEIVVSGEKLPAK